MSEEGRLPTKPRLSRLQWLRAEEEYRQGTTQAEIARKYDIRIETVSRHMTQMKIKGGEKVDKVKQEIEAAVTRRKREWAENLAKRKISTKEQLLSLTQVVLGMYARDLQKNKESTVGTAENAILGKSLKESMVGLDAAFTLMAKILEMRPNEDREASLPELRVVSMTLEEENALRERGGAIDDDEDEDTLREVAAMADGTIAGVESTLVEASVASTESDAGTAE